MVVFSCGGLYPRAGRDLVIGPEEDDDEDGRVGLYPTVLAQGKDGIKHAERVPSGIARDAAVLDVGPACVGVGEEASVPEDGWVPRVLRVAVACDGGERWKERRRKLSKGVFVTGKD